MRSFYPNFILILTFLHACLFWNLRRVWPSSGWRWGYLVLALAVIGTWAFPVTRRWLTSQPRLLELVHLWMGFLIIMAVPLLARGGLALAARLADKIAGTGFSRWLGPGSVAAALGIGVLLFGYALFEARFPRVREVAVETDRLPPGSEPVRVAFLSDVHITSTTWLWTLERLAAKVNALNPDIVILGGDIVDWKFSPGDPRAAALRKMRGRAGSVAVVGNHELYSGLQQFLDFIEAAGYDVLRGGALRLAGIEVVGVDDVQVKGRVTVPEALAKADGDGFVLLASHRPDIPREAAGLFDAALTGHTHGGQVWPFGILTRRFHGIHQGANEWTAPPGSPREKSLVYVSNGTFTWGPPVRLFTRGEVTLLKIVRKN